MPELLARTLSQGLQAFMPAAVYWVWLRRSGQAATVTAVRRGLLCAVPLTGLGAWLFQRSLQQAKWEALMAFAAIGPALACGVDVWRRRRRVEASPRHRLGMGRQLAAMATAALIVVRQSAPMTAVFVIVAFQARSLEGTAAMAGGAALAVAAAVGWIVLGKRLPESAVASATRAFAVLFLAQIAFYAVHRSAEARLLPWGDLVDAATEPYGPDSAVGRDISYLLIGLPMTAAIADLLYRCASRTTWPAARGAAALRRAGIALTLIALAGTTAHGVFVSTLQSPAAASSQSELSPFLAAPHVLFLSRAVDGNDGVLSVATLRAPSAANRAHSSMRCARISFGMKRGICLQVERGVLFTSYRAVLFDERLQPTASIKLEGRPTRTRISQDGRVGAVTTFVTGHGYVGSFSTKTILLDMDTGDVLGDLEQFSTWRDGQRFSAPDFNFWGVTFARDSHVFFASLRTFGDFPLPGGGTTHRAETYLVRGDLALRKMTVLGDNVECPSLSPNNRLIAFKKSVGAGLWRFSVLDLTTMKERPIAAEARSIDDQIEWLDDSHVLYSTFRSAENAIMDVSVASIDGSEPVRVFVPGAESPIVVR